MKNSPVINGTSFGEITVDGRVLDHDVYILATGEVKKRKKSLAKEVYGTSHKIGPKELKKLCKDKPEVLFVGTGQSGVAELTGEGRRFLEERKIEFHAGSTPEVIDAYNKCRKTKSALIHVTC